MPGGTIHTPHAHKIHRPELKKFVTSVFSMIHGTDASRRLKLRQNTDANVIMVKDPSIKSAKYQKPTRKLNEHEHSHSDMNSHSSGSGDELHHRHKKCVVFNESVEEICFRRTLQTDEDKKAAAHNQKTVLELLDLDCAVPTSATVSSPSDELLQKVINARKEKDAAHKAALEEEKKFGPGPIITFIPLDGEHSSQPSSPTRLFRAQTLRKSAHGHGDQQCELLLRTYHLDPHSSETDSVNVTDAISDEDHAELEMVSALGRVDSLECVTTMERASMDRADSGLSTASAEGPAACTRGGGLPPPHPAGPPPRGRMQTTGSDADAEDNMELSPPAAVHAVRSYQALKSDNCALAQRKAASPWPGIDEWVGEPAETSKGRIAALRGDPSIQPKAGTPVPGSSPRAGVAAARGVGLLAAVAATAAASNAAAGNAAGGGAEGQGDGLSHTDLLTHNEALSSAETLKAAPAAGCGVHSDDEEHTPHTDVEGAGVGWGEQDSPEAEGQYDDAESNGAGVGAEEEEAAPEATVDAAPDEAVEEKGEKKEEEGKEGETVEVKKKGEK